MGIKQTQGKSSFYPVQQQFSCRLFCLVLRDLVVGFVEGETHVFFPVRDRRKGGKYFFKVHTRAQTLIIFDGISNIIKLTIQFYQFVGLAPIAFIVSYFSHG